jgi:hypothetical protein
MRGLTPLLEFLGGSRWKDRFDDEILAAAPAWVAKVRDLQMETSGPDTPETFTLRGRVRNEATEVSLWQSGGQWDLETTCTCETGSFCHHAAAVLLKAAKERDPQRLLGHSVAAAVAAALPSARDLPKAPPPDRPWLAPDPRFELHVTRGPTDRTTRLLLQSLGLPAPEQWIFAEAVVDYDGHRSPLRASAPEWVSTVTQGDGQTALL